MQKNSTLKLLIFVLMIISLTLAQNTTTDTTTDDTVTGNTEIYEGLVLGVGQGTLAVCAFGIIGLIICFFKDCTATPSFMVAAGISLPLLVLLIVWFIPKESLSTDTEKEDKLPTDAFRIRTGIFSALVFLICIMMSLILCASKMTTLTGQKVDSEQYNNVKKRPIITKKVDQQDQKKDEQAIQEGHSQIMDQNRDEEALPLKDNQEQEGLRPLYFQEEEQNQFMQPVDQINQPFQPGMEFQQYDEDDHDAFQF